MSPGGIRSRRGFEPQHIYVDTCCAPSGPNPVQANHAQVPCPRRASSQPTSTVVRTTAGQQWTHAIAPISTTCTVASSNTPPPELCSVLRLLLPWRDVPHSGRPLPAQNASAVPARSPEACSGLTGQPLLNVGMRLAACFGLSSGVQAVCDSLHGG
ncbi:hypothetical protein BD413DRAFT_593166 [Trametes elegans]|nr:hypothetical protein BD413DRAFT_593166 [Trametes elegans]